MCLMLFHLPINLSVLPLFIINIASNKVKTPGWVTLIMGICNAFLAVVLPLACGWGIYGVAAAGAIVLTLKNAFFIPWYATRVLGVRVTTFNAAMLPGVIGADFTAILAYSISRAFVIAGWWSLILASVLVALAYFLACWLWAVNPYKHKILHSMLLGRSET
jgi:hypothetical protein